MIQPHLSCQVLIAGAGPTGLTVANLLGRHGVRTILVERNPGVSEIPKALFVDDEFFRTLNGLGLGAALADHALAPVDFEYRSPLGIVLARIDGRVTLNNFHNRNAIFQPKFERILLDGVARYPEVTVLFEHALDRIERSDDAVTAHVLGPDGAPRIIATEYLLGCDGAHSVVRGDLGLEFEDVVDFTQRHIVIDALDDADDSRTAVLICHPKRQFTSLPVPDGGRRFEITLYPEDDAEEALTTEALTGFFKPWRDFSEINVLRKVVYSFHARLVPRMQSGRVFLLGDAAHVMPPFGSQGMNSGARDANNLAWKLALALDGKAGSALLESYHRERHEQVRATILMSTNIARAANVHSRIAALARDALFAVLSLFPKLKRRLTEAPYVPRPVLRDGFLVPPAGGNESRVGYIVPQPRVRLGEQVRLLDEILGPGFALVGVDPTDGVPPVLAHPFWQAVGAAWLVLRPAGASRGAVDGIVTATVEDHRFDALFATEGGRWLVVRPDRVVAAVATGDELEAVADALAAQLAADFE